MTSESFKILWVGTVVLCCLAVGVADGAPGPTTPDSIETSTEAEHIASNDALHQLQQSNVSAPATAIRVGVHPNGSATWTIHYRFRLGDANETTAFDQLRADIASNPATYRERFRQRLAPAVVSAERTTDREMAIENIDVRATRNETIGVVTYEFVWTNFATTDGNRLRVDDVLAGLYLGNETRLTVGWPDAYEAVAIRPTPTDRRPNAASWAGSTDFDHKGLVVELVRLNATANGAGSEAEEGSNGALASGIELPLSSIGLLVLVLLLGGLGVVWVARQRQTANSTASVTTATSDSERTQETPAEGDSTNTTPEPTANPESGEDPQSSEEQGGPALLSNEERVIGVLKRSGGRAKQQQVVDELGWTDAKTSSVVSQLRDDGTIESFRLGRENVLELPDDEPMNDADETANGT